MESITEIPDSWNVSDDAEVVMLNPHTGETSEQLSSSGAGPHRPTVIGTVQTKPCEECGAEMSLDAEMAGGHGRVLKCPNGHRESANLKDH